MSDPIQIRCPDCGRHVGEVRGGGIPFGTASAPVSVDAVSEAAHQALVRARDEMLSCITGLVVQFGDEEKRTYEGRIVTAYSHSALSALEDAFAILEAHAWVRQIASAQWIFIAGPFVEDR